MPLLLATVSLLATKADWPQERPWACHVIDDSSRGADGARLADINGDGWADIATGWEEGGVTRVYINPGPARSRTKWPAITVGNTPSVEDAVFVDLDQDGVADVVSCCEGETRTVYVHWAPPDASGRTSSAAWRQEPIPATQGLLQWMFAHPMQMDGANGVDLVVGGKGPNARIGWLQAPPNPRDLAAWRWRPMSEIGWLMSIILSDMDHDGDEDVLLTDRRGELRGCRWLENPGPGAAQSGNWPCHFVGGRDAEVMFMTTADLDGDGFQDVLAAAKRAQVLYFRRLDNGGKQWVEVSIPYPAGMGTAKAVAVGDIDLDGRPDLVVSCENADPPKSGVRWMSYERSPLEPNWRGHEISGPAGIKFDLVQLLDLDGDGDLDVLTCEEAQNLGLIWYENPYGWCCPAPGRLGATRSAALQNRPEADK